MFTIKKITSVFFLSFALAFGFCPQALAQNEAFLHIVKSTVNAESENAEICLEFDKPLAPASPSRLAAALRLEANDQIVIPSNIIATDSSLCLFPLERGVPYRLGIKGLRGSGDEKMAASYTSSFTIPDRSPSLAFASENGGVNEFGSYDKPLTLRTVNVTRANIDVYRITDIALMAHVWQDRMQTALAPSESAALARDKGLTIWREEETFDSPPNATAEQKIDLREKMPDLAPGLYLIVADAGNVGENSANQGLAPMAAAWFLNSDFSLRAVRDSEGIHVFASGPSDIKSGVHLTAFSKESGQLAEADIGAGGIGLIPYPPDLADKNDIVRVIGADQAGHVAFADIENLPSLSGISEKSGIHVSSLFVAPLDSVDVILSPAKAEKDAKSKTTTILRLLQGDAVYADIPAPVLSAESAKLTFSAPALPGDWTLRWQKNEGTVLAETTLRVTTNPDAPRLEAIPERNFLTDDGSCSLSIKSLSVADKPTPLIGGRVLAVWQKLDAGAFGWKDYHFGNPTEIPDAFVPVATFLTDLDGATSLHFTLPPHPSERGLYQAALKIVAEPDTGVSDAPTLFLPLHPEETVIGLKPLAVGAHFPQNGLARFALIGLSSDGKPRDVSGLSYQIYEEGRSFAWYQDEGRWKYKPAAQLRPIGGGALSIEADASSVLEAPVTAGNYRLEILDANGKILAQTAFSAGWDSTGAASTPSLPLNAALPKIIQPGHEVLAHVALPEPSMLTAIIADQRIRKIVHEFRPKGDTIVAFTPGADWAKSISLTFEALPMEGSLRRAVIEADVAHGKTDSVETVPAGTSIVAAYDPSALVLRKDGAATLSFGIENTGQADETYHYSFTASPGLEIDDLPEGDIALGGKQSKSLPLSIFGDSEGAKELRLEVTSAHTPRLIHNWPMAVLPEAAFLHSVQTVSIPPRQNLQPVPDSSREETTVFISRRPMSGLAEILTYVFNARPFTTEELALSLDALRLWRDTMDQAGIAPDFITDARERGYLARLLRHQNSDGGFAPYRGGDSTMEDTAVALVALGAASSKQAEPAKNLAIAWIKQRLSNTWFDEKERSSRAAAYAALAAADAIDPASLHYFSDTGATISLPPVTEAQIAAAFKRINDPDAAAFWIKKMLDENGRLRTIPLLNALTATDALPSDDVLAATSEMGDALRSGSVPEIKDAAALLRAIAANSALAGKGRIAGKNETRAISGVLALRGGDAPAYRSDDTQLLYETFVSEADSLPLPHKASLSRRIYRLNGIDLSPSAKPSRGEIYLVEIKGEIPTAAKGAPVLVQQNGNELRPVGCPLSPQLDTLSFIPWLTTHGLTPFSACEFSFHEIDVVLAPSGDKSAFSIIFPARIDTQAISDVPMPKLRVLK
jgi:hypothetical protein